MVLFAVLGDANILWSFTISHFAELWLKNVIHISLLIGGLFVSYYRTRNGVVPPLATRLTRAAWPVEGATAPEYPDTSRGSDRPPQYQERGIFLCQRTI